MTLAMGVVFDLLQRAIGPGSVAFSTLGCGGSTVCVTFDLVRCAMGSSFYWVYGTLCADRVDLGVGMNTIVSEAGGWTGA